MSKNHEFAREEIKRQMKVARVILDADRGDHKHFAAIADIDVLGRVHQQLECERTEAWLRHVAETTTDEALTQASGTSIYSDAIEQLNANEQRRAWANAARTLRRYAADEVAA